MVQGIVESEPNGYPRLPVVCRLQCKENGSPNCPTKKVDILHGISCLGKKLVFHTGICY